MRPLHSRKRRATLADAHQHVREHFGYGVSANDYLQDEERMQIAIDASEALQNVTRVQFPRTGNLEYAILKTHLIVEFALTRLIRCSSCVLVEPEAIRFTFSQKLEIAVLLGFAHWCPTTVPSVEILNRIRNQVAHRFSFDRALVLELVRLANRNEQPAKLTDRQLISCLRAFSAFICGSVAGHILSLIQLSQDDHYAREADAPKIEGH
jgi:hypothetical protein